MFLFGWWRLFRGSIRRGLLLTYYGAIESRSLFGMACRIWGWLNNASRDNEVVERPEFKWGFELSEEVQIRRTKHVGMIWYRWIRFGWKLYEVKVGRSLYVFYEDQLAKTDLRVYSKVAIKEVRFKKLEEGHFTMPTKRWTPHYHSPYYSYPMATYWNESQQTAAKQK